MFHSILIGIYIFRIQSSVGVFYERFVQAQTEIFTDTEILCALLIYVRYPDPENRIGCRNVFKRNCHISGGDVILPDQPARQRELLHGALFLPFEQIFHLDQRAVCPARIKLYIDKRRRRRLHIYGKVAAARVKP